MAKPKEIRALTDEEAERFEKDGTLPDDIANQDLPNPPKAPDAPPPVTEVEKVKKAIEKEPVKKADKVTGFVAFYNATLNPITLNASQPLETGATYYNLPADGTAVQVPKERAERLMKMKVVQRWIETGCITVGAPPKSRIRATSDPKPVGELANARKVGNETVAGAREAKLEKLDVTHLAFGG